MKKFGEEKNIDPSLYNSFWNDLSNSITLKYLKIPDRCTFEKMTKAERKAREEDLARVIEICKTKLESDVKEYFEVVDLDRYRY